jgi:hypothetical protein
LAIEKVGIFKGDVDFIALRDVIKDIGFSGYAIVEQDMYPAPLISPSLSPKEPAISSEKLGSGSTRQGKLPRVLNQSGAFADPRDSCWDPG